MCADAHQDKTKLTMFCFELSPVKGARNRETGLSKVSAASASDTRKKGQDLPKKFYYSLTSFQCGSSVRFLPLSCQAVYLSIVKICYSIE